MALDAADLVTGDESIGNKAMDAAAMAVGGFLGSAGGPLGSIAGAGLGKTLSDGAQALFGGGEKEKLTMEEAIAVLKAKEFFEMDWLGLLKGVTGQTAANVLDADQDKYVVDANGNVLGVKRDPIESFFDNALGRTEEIQEEGKRRYIENLSQDEIVKELRRRRPDIKVTGSDTIDRFAGQLLDVREVDDAISFYRGQGGSKIPTAELRLMDPGAIRVAGIKEGNKLASDRKMELDRLDFYSPQSIDQRERRDKADLLQLDLNALERETRRGERDLDNRRQDLRELEFRMKENRLNRNDRQAAIAKIIEGIANMGYAITSKLTI